MQDGVIMHDNRRLLAVSYEAKWVNRSRACSANSARMRSETMLTGANTDTTKGILPTLIGMGALLFAAINVGRAQGVSVGTIHPSALQLPDTATRPRVQCCDAPNKRFLQDCVFATNAENRMASTERMYPGAGD
jgi:hypothetical protein